MNDNKTTYLVLGIFGTLIAIALFVGSNNQGTSPNPSSPATPVQPAKPSPTPSPADKVEVLFFTQTGCSPCESMKRTLESGGVASKLTQLGVTVRRIHDDREAFARFQVSGTPTCRLVRTAPDGTLFLCGDPLIGSQRPAAVCKWLDGVINAPKRVGHVFSLPALKECCK